MSHLSFDEISDRYNQLSQINLTEEDCELVMAIYYNIVANLVEKAHTANGVIQFIGSEVNEYNIFDFVPTEEISLSENWGDHLEDWELNLLLGTLPEGYKLDLIEGVWGKIANLLVKGTKAVTRTRKPSTFINPIKRVQAAQRSKRLGKPPVTKFNPNPTPSGARSGSYGSTGGKTKYSPRSTGDEAGVSVNRSNITQPTSKTAAQRAYETAKRRDQRINTQRAQKSAEREAARAVKKSEAAARKNAQAATPGLGTKVKGGAKKLGLGALTLGGLYGATEYLKNKTAKDTTPTKNTTVTDKVPNSSYRKGEDVGLNDGKSSGSNGSSGSNSSTCPSGSNGSSGSSGSSGSNSSTRSGGSSSYTQSQKREDKLLDWVMRNPKRAREIEPGSRDYETIRKILSKEEWITSYPELAKTITEKKEVTQMHNETIDAYDIILDYLIENGHAETVDEANYVMLEMSEDHLQTIVQLSIEQ